MAKKTAAEGVAALLAARETWLELEPGRRLRVRRPVETLLPELRRAGPLGYCDLVVDWQGFGWGDVQPDAAPPDAAEPLPCEPALVRELLGDRSEWMAALIEHVRERVVAHAEAAEARRKN